MFDKNSDYVVLTVEQVSQGIPSKPLSHRMLQLRQASFHFIVSCKTHKLMHPLQLLPMSFGPDALPPPGAPGY
jgi:hypothetical protein